MNEYNQSLRDSNPNMLDDFGFYTQVRKAELKESDPSQKDELVLRTIELEWKGLDKFKKKQFVIPEQIQIEMRKNGRMEDINYLRNAVL